MQISAELRYAGVLARHRGQVALVREEFPAWGRPCWNIPSGHVEDGETPEQGACRELAEETGLLVPSAGLVLVSTSSVITPDVLRRAWTFSVEVDDPSLCPRDPDGAIQDARWFPVVEAVSLLQQLPYRPLREPATALLRGRCGMGGHWVYSDPESEPVITFGSG
ncbi:MAG: NUDIX hydrolase [Motilibacteraceae bacterium]